MVYTIQDDVDTTTLPNIQRDSVRQSAGVTPIALPESDASEAILIPTTGPLARISVSGITTGSVATIQTFITKLKHWIEIGGKLSKDNVSYVSTLNGTFSARVIDGSWNWVAGDPQKLVWNLELIQGTFT